MELRRSWTSNEMPPVARVMEQMLVNQCIRTSMAYMACLSYILCPVAAARTGCRRSSDCAELRLLVKPGRFDCSDLQALSSVPETLHIASSSSSMVYNDCLSMHVLLSKDKCNRPPNQIA